MTNIKLDNNLLNNVDFDDMEIDKDIEEDIEYYIKEFKVDNREFGLVSIPKNLNKVVKSPFKEIKKEKRKNRQLAILDMVLVGIILLPVIGIFYPKAFMRIPKVYNILENINEFIQFDNLKSIMGTGNEIIEGSGSSSVATIYIEEKDVVKPKSNNEAIKLIHSLANTLVKAEYKWQCTVVTPKTIKLALEGIEEIKDDYDKMHLRNSLRKWEKGDFSNGVHVHNYVWEILGGTVGKASELDKDKIQSIVNEYY